MPFGRSRKRIREEQHSIDIEGSAVPLLVRRHPTAKRMILRVNTGGDGVVVTIPAHVAPEDGLNMARRQSKWIQDNLNKLGGRTPFADGMEIPYLGEAHVIRHHPDRRGTVWQVNRELHVAGQAEHISRRLTDWLKKQARSHISTLAHDKARQLDRDVRHITIRDTRTRWGSCSAKGGLSFSWRLILAPEHVLDYVVAHEVSHLAHMNHSRQFWKTVEELTANYQVGRDWLSAHGSGLHRIG